MAVGDVIHNDFYFVWLRLSQFNNSLHLDVDFVALLPRVAGSFTAFGDIVRDGLWSLAQLIFLIRTDNTP